MKKSAKATYKQLLKRVKKHPMLTTRVAQLELDLGKAKQARDRLRQHVNLDPGNPTLFYLLGQAEHKLKDHEAALAAYETCLEHDPLYRRARVAYADLLAELGRTEQERKVRSEHYEMSAPSPALDDAQKQVLLASLHETVDPGIEWDDRWHPGDFTANGTLARTVVRELEIGPEPVDLPPGAEPPIDDNKVTQMMARLPMGGITLKDVHQEVAEKSVDEPAEIPEPGWDLDEAPAEDAAPPDESSREPQSETPPLPVEESAQTEPEPEPEPATEMPAATPAPPPEPTKTPEPEATEPPAPEAETPDFTELEHQEETEPEHVPTALERALKLAEVEVDEFLDLKALLEELAEDEPPLVEMPVVDESVTRQAEEIDLERLQAEFNEQQAKADADARAQEAQATAESQADEVTAQPAQTAPEASPSEDDEPAPARPKKDPAERNVLSQDALNQLLQSFSEAESTGFETASSDSEADDSEPGAQAEEDAESTPSAPEPEAGSVLDETEPDEAEPDERDPEFVAEPSPDEAVDPAEPDPSDVPPVDEIEDDTAPDVESFDASLTDQDESDAATAATEAEEPAEDEIDEDDQLNSFITELAGESDSDDDVLQEPADSEPSSDDDLDQLLTQLEAVGDSSESYDTESGSDEDEDTASMDEMVNRLEDLDQQETGGEDTDVDASAIEAGEPDADPEPENAPAGEGSGDDTQTPPETPATPRPPEMSIPSGPPPRPRSTPSPVDDELPPEEYRGPVSKTLVRLQIKQGKLEHARAMMSKLRRQHPDDPDVSALAAELEQAGS